LLTLGLAFILLAYIALFSFITDIIRPTYDIAIFIATYFITLFGYWITIKSFGLDKSIFITVVFGSVVIRLLIFSILNFVIIYWSPEDAGPNIVLFFIIYFIFTFIEVMALLKTFNLTNEHSITESK
jgi:hypothetical protein